MGAWNKKHAEAIYNTIGGIPKGHYYGPTTLSKDSTALYLFVLGKTSGQIMLKGLDSKITEITVVSSGTKLSHKIVGKISCSHVPGLVYIDLPEIDLDPYVTVLKLKLDRPIKLYSGYGGFE